MKIKGDKIQAQVSDLFLLLRVSVQFMSPGQVSGMPFYNGLYYITLHYFILCYMLYCVTSC